MLPGIEIDVVSLEDPSKVLSARRSRRNPDSGAECHQGLLEQAEGNRGGLCRRPFLTGDIGYMDDDGYFYLVDRKKDMIISGGFNVYPQMIEQAIYEHPAVQEVIVIGIPDDYRARRPRPLSSCAPAPRRSRWTSWRRSSPASSASMRSRPRSIRRRTAAQLVGKLSRHELRNLQPAPPKQPQLASGGRL